MPNSIQSEDLTWRKLAEVLSGKLKLAVLWAGSLVIDTVLMILAIHAWQWVSNSLSQYLGESFIYEALAMKWTLFVTTTTTVLYYIYKDIVRLVAATRSVGRDKL